MWRAPLVALLLLAGCGHNIGDSCKTNVDCSPIGDRFCDTSEPGGYCTQENCSVKSCPGDSVCIRFFSPLADEPCQTDRPECPQVDERCVCDVTDENGDCVNKSGHCAPSASERRWCQKRCSSDGDCRSGYECRSTGTFGAEPVPTFDNANGEPADFCAPSGFTS
jgi:hypothetical protein